MRLLFLVITLLLSYSAIAKVTEGDSVTDEFREKYFKLSNDERCLKIDSASTLNALVCKTLGQELLQYSTNNLKHQGFGYYGVAQGEYLDEHFSISLTYYDSALTQFFALPDSNKIAKIYNQIGNVNYLTGNDIKAFEYYKKAFEIATLLGRDTLRANLLNNLALISTHQKDYQKADYYNQSALEIFKSHNDEDGIADVYGNMGMSYAYRGDTSNVGQNYLEKSLYIYEKQKNQSGRAVALYFLGKIHENRKEFTISDEYFNQSKTLYESLHDTINIISALEQNAKILIRKKRFIEALISLELGKEMNLKIKSNDGIELFNKGFYEAYKGLGDDKKALESLEKYKSFTDSLNQDTETKKLSYFRAEFDEDIKAKDIENLREASNQKSILLIIISILIISLIVILISYYRHKNTKQKQKMLLLEKKVLRSQMDPHFLFNTMSAIQFFILDGKTEEAIRFLGDFSSLLRLILQHSKDELIPIEKEQKILEFYLQLQNKRFTKRVDFELIIDPELLDEKILIPPMLGQPFIESFLENSGFDKIQDGVIKINYALVEGKINLTISDNGIVDNVVNESLPSKHQYALTTTNDRIYLINSLRRDKVVFSMMANTIEPKKGNKATFTIPISYK